VLAEVSSGRLGTLTLASEGLYCGHFLNGCIASRGSELHFLPVEAGGCVCQLSLLRTPLRRDLEAAPACHTAFTNSLTSCKSLTWSPRRGAEEVWMQGRL
jgi:hypothetical protein